MLVLLGEKELTCATVDHCYHNVVSYPHLHLNMELLYMKTGMRTAVIGDTEYTLYPGDLAVIFPLIVHSYPDRYLPGVHDCISVSPMRLEVFRKALLSEIPVCPVLHKGEIPPRIAQLLEILTETETGDYETELFDGLSMAIAAEILRSVPMQTISACDPDTVSSLFLACTEHYAEPDFSMEKLSRITGISTRSISRFFTERLNVSFPRFHTMLRLQLAERLLVKERKSVTETAFACGFGSIRNFNRCFTELYGIAPSQYRAGK